MYIRRFSLVFLFTAVVLSASGNALADKYRVGREIQITDFDELVLQRDHHHSAVAYNWSQKEYLVVETSEYYYTHYDQITACRVSPNGSKTHLGRVSTDNYAYCSAPDVAYDPYNGKYLIVWSQKNYNTSEWEIYGRIIPWDSLGTNAPFLIATLGWAGLNLKEPAVAFGYNPVAGTYRYMVVWQNVSISNGVPEGICQNLVSVTGSPLTSPAYIDPGPYDGYPDITFNIAAAQFLVVWEGQGSSSGIDIFGRRLGLSGFNEGNAFSVNADSNGQEHPSVTTNTQHRYLVVWQHDWDGTGTDWDIRGQFLDVSGSKVGGVLPIAITYDSETWPDVAASGGIEEYLTVWNKEGNGIWGRLLYTDFSALQSFEITPANGGNPYSPSAGCHNSGYFVTYTWSPSDPLIYLDICGRMLLKPEGNPGLLLLLLGN